MAVADSRRRTEGHGRKVSREKILQALKAGNTRRAAAGYAGIHWDTFYAWLADDPTFSDAVYQAEANPEVICATSIVKAAQKGDWRAGDKWLSKRRRDEWGDEINVRLLSNEQLRALAGAGEEGAGAPGRVVETGGGTDGPGEPLSLPE
jgi:hypothetical protein